ncbi:hypothetical protein [Streptomyces misionensis]|uniref:hypothetical protein n=1 Tax=Streptomyces misionensis TaxID=67331 RepID=UPI0036A6D599
MPDRMRGPGDERQPSSRYARPPDDEWMPEAENTERPETGERPTRRPGPAERLPGEPGGAPPPPPGPAARGHGTEGLRPGTEDLGTAERDRSLRAGGESDLGTSAPNAAPMPDDGLGAPAPGDLSAREARTTEGTAPDAWPSAPGTAESPSGTGAPLLPHEENERWEQRIREVTAGFVDRPRAAVEEADRAVEEIAARFTEAVTRRRRTLRMSWEDTDERGSAAETDTEQLRLALRDYRDLAERLLHS